METQFEHDDSLFRLVLLGKNIKIGSGPVDNPEKFHNTVADVLTPTLVISKRYVKRVQL
jgi:hypothetical protein